MSQLLGPNGQPISSKDLQNKKAPAPKTGEQYGARWGGEDNIRLMALPGGGAIQFDLSRLTLDDYRQMKDHYQINSSLSVLTFMMHQMEWHIELDGPKKEQEFYEGAVAEVWTRLCRSMSQAFWAGYSPNVLQWENDVPNRRIVIDKVKDMYPEDCKVHWKKVDTPDGRPKINIYDGITQFGSAKHIPVDNSFWYPLLMQNGDYYGQKLLRSAFQSWFFSILLHLFANRYYERFGEPTPVGRAPFEDEIELDGQSIKGNEAMRLILSQVRNRSVVVLPNDRTPVGDETNPEFDYQIEYLESQMRGADFERYMTRLDEEMSLALFTPILIMRTADVGSYNLGTQHTQTYLWMLNAISGDWKFYIDRYLLAPLRNFNFGPNAATPKIKFKKNGVENRDLVRDIVQFLIEQKYVRPLTAELGEMTGLTLEEIRTLTADEPADDAPESDDPNEQEEQIAPDEGSQGDPATASLPSHVLERIEGRVRGQVQAAYRKGEPVPVLNLGFRSQLTRALRASGVPNAASASGKYLQVLQQCASDFDAKNSGEFMEQFHSTARNLLDEALT